jgi:glutamyl-Q tRNA(Asp) synthetase
MHSSYVGRFAPSPSGPLHLGSLVSALASYLDAKHNHGKWLLRIEDVDSQRCKPEHSKDIIDTLRSYHLYSDSPVLFQSQRQTFYQAHLETLINHDRAFPCQCTRQTLKQNHGKHSHICQANTQEPHSWRILSSPDDIHFFDRLKGEQKQNPLHQIGHSIIKRKDSDYAYLLAVVVDDHLQGINQVVRGTDLLDTTAAQLHLFNEFNWQAPHYCHIPLVTDEKQLKLSKQNHAPAIKKADIKTLKSALTHLKQPIYEGDSISETLTFAIQHWSLKALSKA